MRAEFLRVMSKRLATHVALVLVDGEYKLEWRFYALAVTPEPFSAILGFPRARKRLEN
jgi:hypothetical protein